MATMNRQFMLAKRPVGMVSRDDFQFAQEPIPEPKDGEFVVKNLYISLNPAMRGWMNDTRSYVLPVQIGEVMRAGAIGRVIASKHPKFNVGDNVFGCSACRSTRCRTARARTRSIPSSASCRCTSARWARRE